MTIKKYFFLIITFIIVQALAIFFININNQSKIDELLKSESELMKTHYHSIYSNFEKLANTVFHGYINKPDIIEKVKNNKRDELYNILKPSYRYLSSVNFKQLHFHTKENISFLRMHKPDKYGDDLTNYRYSINYANTNKQFIAGLEMGRIVPGFRFVYPLFDTNNIHIGSVETSFSVKAFSLKLQELYEVRTNFIIEKALAKKELFDSSSDNFMESIESDKYLALKQTIDPKILKNLDVLKQEYKKNLQKKIKTQLDNNKVFSINAYVNDYPKVITFLPLKDIENRYIGYFVIYRNSDQIKEYSKQLTNKYILSFIFILGLFSFVLREYLHKQNLKDEVDIKTKKLQEVAVKLEVQTEELEELNVSLENRIQLEVDKNTKQERELFQQSKQAALGDMIGNIAHQWRQPLSAISTSASGMQLTHYAGMLKDEDFIDYTDAIINNAKYLSQTIDDFRDFIKSDKKIVRFNLSESIEKCMAIVNSSINNHNLNIQINVEDDLYINNYENELQQAIINIFSNAKDALKDNQIDSDDRIIFIDAHKVVDKVNIVITDTAGGIDENILEKIFEPYFTTKHQSQGTGLGLYMTHQIIIESMKGAIFVENSTFEYNNKTYTGAKFTIEFNLA